MLGYAPQKCMCAILRSAQTYGFELILFVHIDFLLFHPYMVCGCWSYVPVAVVSSSSMVFPLRTHVCESMHDAIGELFCDVMIFAARGSA